MRPAPINPYPGPRPFQHEEVGLFFGREHELDTLLSLVLAHRAVLVYGPSGSGKTSLINAGVIPSLIREGAEVLPTARVDGAGASKDIANVFAFNVITSWASESDGEHLRNLRMADFLASHGSSAENTLRILVFDQFEQLFLSHLDRWRDRADFLTQLGEALNADPSLGAIFSMREDYIAQLDPYLDLIPDRLRTRFRLEPMRADAAMEAVTRPLEAIGCTFEPRAAEQLVEDLLTFTVTYPSGESLQVQGEFADPSHLQVVCFRLWQSLPSDIKQIRVEHIRQLGTADSVLTDYFADCMAKAAALAGITEHVLRRWFQQTFITRGGTRALVYREPDETAGMPNLVLDLLESKHLLRSEFRSGARWFELTHDRFLLLIEESNRDWFAARPAL